MKIKIFAVILLIFAIMLPFSATADQQVEIQLTDVSHILSYGVYISPYYATVGGVTNTQIWCVDFNHWDNIGDQWTAYVTPVMSVVSTDHTYLHNLDTYEKMAWLIQQYNLPAPISEPVPSYQKAAIQWLIWDLSSHQDHSNGYLFSSDYQFWASQLSPGGAYATGDYTGWVILSDTTFATNPSCSAQEFMMKVPESSIILLLGSGLVGLWGFRRRFRK